MGKSVLNTPQGEKVGEFLIGGRVHDIVEVEDLEDNDGVDLLGWYRMANQTILLQKGMAPGIYAIILLHEIVHGWLIEAGYDGERKDVEQVCDIIAYSLYKSLPENAAFFRQLLGGNE